MLGTGRTPMRLDDDRKRPLETAGVCHEEVHLAMPSSDEGGIFPVGKNLFGNLFIQIL